MPTCMVKGCKHRTGQKEKHPSVVLHTFPRSLYYIKQWLIQTKQHFGDIDAFAQKVLDGKKTEGHRMCSSHFTSDCYTVRGSKLLLKEDAIPTIFPGDDDKKTGEDIATGPPVKIFIRVDGTVEKSVHCVDASIQANTNMGVKSTGTSINPKYLKRNVRMQTNIPYEADVGVQCGGVTEVVAMVKSEPNPSRKAMKVQSELTSSSTLSKQRLSTCGLSTCKSIQIKEETPDHIEEYYRPLEVPSKTTSDFPVTKSTVGVINSFVKEEENVPEPYSATEGAMKCDRVSSYENMDKRTAEHHMYYECVTTDNVDERRFFVLESSLEKLFYRIQCGAGLDCTLPVARIQKKFLGSFMSVTGYCINGHEFKIWDRQPI